MGKVNIVAVWLLTALLAVLPTTVCVAADNSVFDAAKAFARSEVWKAITTGRADSATVAVMDNGAIVYSEGFGMADRLNSLPVGKNTLFNMGSISKVYVTTAIMLLVDDGKVRLDAPVATYLPEFTMLDKRYKDITVRMLLNHSSGLPGTVGPNSFGYHYNKDFYRDVLDILAQSHLKHRPGEFAPYCNDGFTLAEMIVAKVSGTSYIGFLQQRIFTPLSLKHTGIGVAERPEKNLRIARHYTESGHALPLESLSLLGSGGLSATAEDLCRFADSFSPAGPHILSPVALAEMKKVQNSDFAGKLRGPNPGFGLGWDFAEIPGLKAKGINVLGKNGGTGQYSSMLITVPDKRISVAVIFSSPKADATMFAYRLLKTYLDGKGIMTIKPDPVTAPVKSEPFPPELAAYEGYYFVSGMLAQVTLDPATNSITMDYTDGAEKVKAFSAVYNNGYFHAPTGKYYFTTVDGRQYLATHRDEFNMDSVAGERVVSLTAPQELAAGLDGRLWLRRNAKAYEEWQNMYPYVMPTQRIPALPGYVNFGGIKKITGPMSASYAVGNMRDLGELKFSEQNGGQWIWLSGFLYSSAATAKIYSGVAANLTIGNQGYNEWLKLDQDAILNFTKPANGRILVFDPVGSLIYDSVVDSGDIFVTAGSFVAVAGEAADSFTVQAR